MDATPSPESPLQGSCLCGGVRFHTFVASRAAWEELPDDGLPRYDERYNV
jgi:hypothetical protein